MKIYAIRRRRLKHLMQLRYGDSQAALAEATGRKAGQVSRWFTGTSPIGEKLARALEHELDLAERWLDEVEPSDGPLIRGCVPLISWVSAGEATEIVDNYRPIDEWEMIPTTVAVKQHTYALRVEGESMLPDFPPGIVIVVEPDMPADVDNYVIARNAEGEVTFKKLIKDAGEFFLKPLNSDYRMHPAAGWEIIGVVVEITKRLI